MRKRLFILFILTSIMTMFIACGNNAQQNEGDIGSSNKNSESELDDRNEDLDDDKTNYSQSFMFMGYNFYYSDNIDMSTTNYGKILGDEECVVIVEAPSEAGIVLELNDVNDVPNACQEYLFNTLEGTIRSLFQFDKTEQVIETSSVVTINGIKMLRVEGVFNNVEDNTSVPYVGCYFLGGPDNNRPLYAVGVAMDETADVESFMDEFAKQIKKQ